MYNICVFERHYSCDQNIYLPFFLWALHHQGHLYHLHPIKKKITSVVFLCREQQLNKIIIFVPCENIILSKAVIPQLKRCIIRCRV